MKRMFCLTALALAWFPGTATAQERSDTLAASRISVMREKARNTTQTGLMHIESKELNSGVAVFGTPDIIKKLQMLPGVAAGNELMSGLYVHGGDGNDNLFLLDGVPLYNISHFGGLFSSFNTDVIDHLDFYKSGFPARYGGRMSSVVDVETREGDMEAFHGSFSLGLIDGRIQLEGPVVKGKTSFNAALRRSWMDLVLRPALWYANRRNGSDEQADGGYAMSDLNARITHRFGPENVLDLSFYTGEDRLSASLDQNRRTFDESGVPQPESSRMQMDVRWGSLTGTARHRYAFSRKCKMQNSLYYSQSHSSTSYVFDIRNWTPEGETGMSMDDRDRSYVREIGLNSQWDWTPNYHHHVRCGLQAVYHLYHSGRSFTSTTFGGGESDSTSGNGEGQDYRAFEPALYAEDEIFLRYNLTLNAGFRYALFASPGKTWHSPEPRMAFKWLLTPKTSAKLSYTRMSQFAHLVAALYMDLPSNCWMPSTANARPMTSDQIAGGFYSTPFRNFTFNLEGWFKTMDHILVYNGGNTFVPPVTEWEKNFAEGKGQSWGLEAEVGYDNERLNLRAYYTLSKTRRNFDAIYGGWYLDRNDNRHKINLVATWHFARNWEIFANWNYHSGNRITFPSHYIEDENGRRYLYDQPYNTRLPDYHRLDVGLDYAKTFSGGRRFRMNLSVYNAYNHLNASLAFLETDKDGHFSGMAYGLVPIIPTLTFTYQF